MSFTTPIPAGQLKKGMHAILRSRPCKITDMTITKTGKHGHAKAHFKGYDVFHPGKKYEDNQPTTHTMQQPTLIQSTFDLLDIDDGYLTLMGDDGETREDLKLPDNEIGQKIKQLFEADEELCVSVLSWGTSEDAVMSYKIQ